MLVLREAGQSDRRLKYVKRTPHQKVRESAPIRFDGKPSCHPRGHPQNDRLGAKVKVVDDKSGEDLTRAVLLQVIAEQDQYGTPVLSTELLEAVIRFYGNPVQEMLTKYMEQSVGTLVRQQEAMRAEMTKALAGPMAPLAEFARQNMDQWSKDPGFHDVGLCRRRP